jgi:hypothetical protein
MSSVVILGVIAPLLRPIGKMLLQRQNVHLISIKQLERDRERVENRERRERRGR